MDRTSFPRHLVVDTTLQKATARVIHFTDTRPAQANEFPLLALHLQQHCRTEHLRITTEAACRCGQHIFHYLGRNRIVLGVSTDCLGRLACRLPSKGKFNHERRPMGLADCVEYAHKATDVLGQT
ncbi:hypothetical protein NKJ90_16415 [Mesorhizobium sp. M0051]|uniref:hypothetical protein n=1 Tax=unclassified Mesorhizobium TaxID=325217 RepID=UPI0012EBC863|nr:hypothetical protein [Mesorhizobium sp. LNHC252B00]